ncbi:MULTISPECIES: hypothetical protein [unclassified Ensifer]|jgi:hypothetical protein|uniref:hypothetical protein n=1 Tax=unclassified Ensifer TaxID=2633371 RepID=UPI00070DEEB9|nr:MULTISPECIES: hypothetical protein [unclassified Ensifer]KQW46803.1 hypothetical protein ASD02_34595 [Ensifer sp. Root1252]KQW60319.1 hypothetical protein ASD03_36910 [Ensifer sp. Root127]KRC69357.1 hypothetical protein ASE32_34415 [Ensifer sp. Root231]KRC96633.1 hypothetical protein ASE47_30680 [Ensifer sp. Root258]
MELVITNSMHARPTPSANNLHQRDAANRALFADADFHEKFTINRLEAHPSSKRHRSLTNDEIEIGLGRAF